MRKKFIPTDKYMKQEINSPDYYEFDTIAMMLKKGNRVRDRDLVNFKKYADEGQSLEDTLKDFLDNHQINYVDKNLFKRWLESLGWRQEHGR